MSPLLAGSALGSVCPFRQGCPELSVAAYAGWQDGLIAVSPDIRRFKIALTRREAESQRFLDQKREQKLLSCWSQLGI